MFKRELQKNKESSISSWESAIIGQRNQCGVAVAGGKLHQPVWGYGVAKKFWINIRGQSLGSLCCTYRMVICAYLWPSHPLSFSWIKLRNQEIKIIYPSNFKLPFLWQKPSGWEVLAEGFRFGLLFSIFCVFIWILAEEAEQTREEEREEFCVFKTNFVSGCNWFSQLKRGLLFNKSPTSW